MCDGRGGFHILWIWFSNCTAFYVGCKSHIVLILSGVIWCRYVALYAYGVFSFTYVMNFIVIIDLMRCCFLQYGALALFGWAGVAGTVTCAVDIVEGFMLSIFVLLTGLRYAHFWCAVIQYFPRPAVMFFHLIFCPHHFSTQTDAPASPPGAGEILHLPQGPRYPTCLLTVIMWENSVGNAIGSSHLGSLNMKISHSEFSSPLCCSPCLNALSRISVSLPVSMSKHASRQHPTTTRQMDKSRRM